MTTRDSKEITSPGRERVEYELVVRQQPKHARMCVAGVADRRPIDPPPVVQLVLKKEGKEVDHNGTLPAVCAEQTEDPAYFMVASLCAPDVDDDLRMLNDGQTCSTAGSTVSPLHRVKDCENDDADVGLFVFPDISVRMEGSYRLKLTLYELLRTGNLGSVHYRQSIFSTPIDVYTAKKFPGMQESTPLTCSLAEQSVKIRVRKFTRHHYRSIVLKEASTPIKDGTSPSLGTESDSHPGSPVLALGTEPSTCAIPSSRFPAPTVDPDLGSNATVPAKRRWQRQQVQAKRPRVQDDGVRASRSTIRHDYESSPAADQHGGIPSAAPQPVHSSTPLPVQGTVNSPGFPRPSLITSLFGGYPLPQPPSYSFALPYSAYFPPPPPPGLAAYYAEYYASYRTAVSPYTSPSQGYPGHYPQDMHGATLYYPPPPPQPPQWAPVGFPPYYPHAPGVYPPLPGTYHQPSPPEPHPTPAASSKQSGQSADTTAALIGGSSRSHAGTTVMEGEGNEERGRGRLEVLRIAHILSPEEGSGREE